MRHTDYFVARACELFLARLCGSETPALSFRGGRDLNGMCLPDQFALRGSETAAGSCVCKHADGDLRQDTKVILCVQMEGLTAFYLSCLDFRNKSLCLLAITLSFILTLNLYNMSVSCEFFR